MRRRSKMLRVAKWGGVVVCVLFVATWVMSIFWGLGCHTSHHSFLIDDGEVLSFRFEVEKQPRWSIHRQDVEDSRYGFTLPSYTRSAVLLDDGTTPSWTVWSVPIWMPFLLTVAASSYLCWIDRRPLPGHCPCGYDLTGNVSGTCPECGRGIA